MIARAVFVSPIRKERRIVHERHTRRLGPDTMVVHAADGRNLHASAFSFYGERALDVYLCRGWGQIEGVGDILRGLVAAADARILDEWGRPMPEFAPRATLLPVATTADHIRQYVRTTTT